MLHVIVSTMACLYCIWRGLPSVLPTLPGVDPYDLSARLCSLLHGILVAVLGTLTCCGVAELAWLGPISL